MNADGLDDIVAVASTRGEVRVLLQGARGLTRPAATFVAELPSTPGYVIDVLEVGDVSADGCPDIAVARLGSLMVLHGTGANTEHAYTPYAWILDRVNATPAPEAD